MRFFSLALLSLFAAVATTAQGAFILDDFDDPAETASPEMADEFVETENVGDLHATRSIRIGSTREPVVGSIDSAVTAPSALSFGLRELPEQSDHPPVVAYQFDYKFASSDSTEEFAPKDLTEGGKNEALFVDFESFSAEASDPILRVIITQLTGGPSSVGSYTVASYTDSVSLSGSLLSEEPFTVPFLFSDLGFRGGGATDADLTAVVKVNIEVTQFYTPEDAQWSGQINAVRIGAIAVPEPNNSWLMLLGGLTSFGVRRRRFPVRSIRMRSADPP